MLQNIKRKIIILREIFKKKFINLKQLSITDGLKNDNPKNIQIKQFFIFGLGVIVLIIGFLLFIYLKIPFISENNNIRAEKSKDQKPDNYQLKLATDSVKGEKKWQSYLEDKMDEEQKARNEQITLLEDSLNQKEAAIKTSQDTEFNEIKARLSFTLKELERLKLENRSIKDEISMISFKEEEVVLPADLSMRTLEDNEEIALPESNYNYIPATSYVTGKLLGGIAVSTSVSASSAPIPVVIRLEARGNLPKDFAVDIKHCRILASAYGDISSERAIIRAEEMVCENRHEGLIIITRVAGVIHGDDGMNGIRGSVVSMSEKHFKNAFTSGVLSGFANTASGRSGLNITSLGAVDTKSKGARELATDGLAKGASTAAEKLADYHIKLAENISPVILVPGGTKVDVMFTKGVHVGSRNIRDKLEKARGNKDKGR